MVVRPSSNFRSVMIQNAIRAASAAAMKAKSIGSARTRSDRGLYGGRVCGPTREAVMGVSSLGAIATGRLFWARCREFKPDSGSRAIESKQRGWRWLFGGGDKYGHGNP